VLVSERSLRCFKHLLLELDGLLSSAEIAIACRKIAHRQESVRVLVSERSLRCFKYLLPELDGLLSSTETAIACRKIAHR